MMIGYFILPVGYLDDNKNNNTVHVENVWRILHGHESGPKAPNVPLTLIDDNKGCYAYR